MAHWLRFAPNRRTTPGAKDVARVLRVPGFFHQKICAKKGQTGAPHFVKITWHSDAPRYTDAEIAAAFRPLKPEPNGHATHDSLDALPDAWSFGDDEHKVRDALTAISADDRDVWLRVGMALHSSGHREIWDDWSKTSNKFDQAAQAKTWSSFNANRGDSITLATVYKLAHDAGWKPREKFAGNKQDQGGNKSYGPASTEPSAWPEPTPLPGGLLPVDEFDPDFLPDAIAPWVMDIADRMQCPPDFVGIPAIVALSSQSIAAPRNYGSR
jgi:Primase C terminal 2 (PriCT-2)